MSVHEPITLTLDRRLLEHPRAHHLRRMRAGIWLYLDLLARLPAGASALEVEPAAVAREMGLPEGTIRSWLGHLHKGGYVTAQRLNGTVRITPKQPAAEPKPRGLRKELLTGKGLAEAFGEAKAEPMLSAAISLYTPRVIEQALTATLEVPKSRIRRSRSALFLYLLKHHDKTT